MMLSLDRLAKMPGSTVVLPGHNYAAPKFSTIGAELTSNDFVLQAVDMAPKLREAMVKERTTAGALTRRNASATLPNQGVARLSLRAYLTSTRSVLSDGKLPYFPCGHAGMPKL